MRTEVRIAGFGGQGVMLAGTVLVQAAGVYGAKEVAQTESYGPEARGGAARCDVVISDERILYPRVRRPSVLLCMSQPALDRYVRDCDLSRSLIVVDATLVQDLPDGARLARVEATSLADACGSRMAANMVMLGALARVSSTVSLDSLKQAVRDVVAARFQDLDLKALDAGYQGVMRPI
jgi:2-oxoglutarate ferredoxin oxidoreductase subunit gamma